MLHGIGKILKIIAKPFGWVFGKISGFFAAIVCSPQFEIFAWFVDCFATFRDWFKNTDEVCTKTHEIVDTGKIVVKWIIKKFTKAPAVATA